MKYKFEKVDLDTTKVIIGNEEYEIKKDVKLLYDMQNIPALAEDEVVYELQKRGLTPKDMVKEIKKDGKTLMDHSALDELKNNCQKRMTQELINNKFKEVFGKNLVEFILAYRPEDEEKFTEEFFKALTGAETKTPSKSE